MIINNNPSLEKLKLLDGVVVNNLIKLQVRQNKKSIISVTKNHRNIIGSFAMIGF